MFDEDLPAPPTSHTRHALALGAVVLVGVALVVRLQTREARQPHAVASSSAAPSSPAPSVSPRPVPVPAFPRVVPAGRATTLLSAAGTGAQTVVCPVDATRCSVLITEPAPVRALFRQRQLDVVSVQTLVADRPGRFEPDLVARLVSARNGLQLWIVTITKAVTTTGVRGQGAIRPRDPPITSTHATVTIAGFTVRAVVITTRGTPRVPVSDASRLARNPALLAP